ncbi:NAD(P)-dependent oxidoreductase [Mycolicibacterium smegmatis]|uniref:Glyoxylate reductase n=1 Tax=Mycolicibacterium smegmatis (strain MKD8) TaxID=1214915 RepID=A0A2U9PP48_MYCSE|nr:NAD(P)-dependent oxidoreductase [Mycolicibacterium smegmatis]AWT53487.1 glyoxylate reductase [Mycolicibacterium smegmatis MKD8]
MSDDYVVGLTADGADATGATIFGDIGLHRLEEAGISWRLLPPIPAHGPVDPAALAGVDAVVSFGHIPFSAELVRQVPRLRHIARFGAGYDGIDPVALAREGVVLTNTPAAVRRPLALSGLTLLLACAHRLLENHRVTVSGKWALQRGAYRGTGVDGRTVGILGFGSVGSELAGMLAPLGVEVIATTRSGRSERAAQLGVELVDRETLAARSDFVVVTAALTEENRGMLDESFFAAMRSSAYFINIARGGLVDQPALTRALRDGGIAGAALDVYDPEPPAADDPLFAMDNVICTPHALCWTADFTRDVSRSVIDALIAVSRNEIPETALGREALDERTWRGRAAAEACGQLAAEG